VAQRTYEILFIADPNLGEAEVDTLTTTVQGYAEKEGGAVTKVEKWGKKRLAYLIGKHREGSYVLLSVDGEARMVSEIERRIRVTDGVIKHITVRVDEDLRKAERRKAARAVVEEKRKARGVTRPAPVSDEEASL
jgi:small subunit ribosomal protein S6